MTLVYIVGLLACGSLNTITMKISLSMPGVGLDGHKKTFQKPWFITLIMFVAMATALIVDYFQRLVARRKGRTGAAEPLLDISPSRGLAKGNGEDAADQITKAVSAMREKSEPFQEAWGDYCNVIDHDKKRVTAKASQDFLDFIAKFANKAIYFKKIMLVSIPACFDIAATGLCAMGFLYISASVWQLLRGAEMIFAAMFASIFLRQKMYAFNILGLVSCVLGITLVGVASIMGTRAHSGSEDTNLVMFGMFLALAGQVVQAAQVTAEEWLMKDVDLPGNVVCGFEGVWGFVVMQIFCFPLFYFLPGNDGGHFENEIDTIVMLGSSGPLLTMFLVYTCSCAVYNMAGIAVTADLTAVHRVMLEALRTLIVWAFDLYIHYYVDATSPYGEFLTPWSSLEIIGFVFIVLGQAIYGGMLKVPGMKYPPEPKEPMSILSSPGSIRNLGLVQSPAKGFNNSPLLP